jgi:hypothetical protein
VRPAVPACSSRLPIPARINRPSPQNRPAQPSSAHIPRAAIGSPRENHKRPNEQCSRQQAAGATSQQRSTLPASGGAQSPNGASERARVRTYSSASSCQKPSPPNSADPLTLIRPARRTPGHICADVAISMLLRQVRQRRAGRRARSLRCPQVRRQLADGRSTRRTLARAPGPGS